MASHMMAMRRIQKESQDMMNNKTHLVFAQPTEVSIKNRINLNIGRHVYMALYFKRPTEIRL